MTRFIDGPAKGQALSLARAPFLLRVTEENGKWDALDKPEDSPRPTETVHVYRIHTYHGMCHVYRGRNGSGFFAMADYQLNPTQPEDAVIRDNARFSQWCEGFRHECEHWQKEHEQRSST